MKLATAVTFLAAALVLLLAFYMHDSAHRFDVVLAAAASGGSQQDAGTTTTIAYLIDHKTGRVWELDGVVQAPLAIGHCPVSMKETERGCEVATAPGSK
jgi:hypothetical protein